MRAVRAVFDSWNTPRAQVYRRANDIPDDIGTAVNVVQMVFGNKGDRSGTGVALHPQPLDRRAGALRRVPRQRAGRGRRRRASARRSRSSRWRRSMPEAYEQLLATMQRLEEHYRDMQDVEFTVEDGVLYMLQTRSAKRTAAAALKAAVDMVDEGTDRPRGGGRADRPGAARPAPASAASTPTRRPSRSRRGLNASPGAASGAIVFDADTRRRAGEGRPGDPRPLGDDARRHPRDDRGAGDPDRARRHDLARGGRRARDGQAVRRRLRGPRSLEGGVARLGGHELREGDVITIDGGSGKVYHRRGSSSCRRS